MVSKFVYAEKVFSALDVAVATSKNLLLYGAGGHGKSEMVEHYFAQNNIKPFTMTFGEGMTEEKLWGGIDIPLFQRTGKIQYLLENSFINHEFVVFEELFDAPTQVLLSLKDVLTSKRVRNGNQVAELKTSVIIACSNRSPDEVGQDLSSKALLERFPLQHEVRWERYGFEEYMTLLSSVIPDIEEDVNGFISTVLAKHSEKGNIISPRTAVHAAQVVLECGLKGLQFVAGLDSAIIDENIALIEKIKAVRAQKETIMKIRDAVAKIDGSNKKDDTVKIAFIKRVKELRKEINAISAYDENIPLFNDVRNRVDMLLNKLIDSV